MISVIVPVYNVEKYIHRCIDSILAQTFEDFELILVDDGSSDGSASICDEYAKKNSRIIVIHKDNNGATSAINAGLDWIFNNSDSEWITIVDSDDFIHPQMLEFLHKAALSTESKVVVGDAVFFSNCNDIKQELTNYHSVSVEQTPTEDFYVESSYIETVWWGKLYKKECFRNIRYPIVKQNGDNYVTYKILFSSDTVTHLQYPIYYYYGNPSGVSLSKWNPRRIKIFDALDESIEFFEKNGYLRARKKIIIKYANFLHWQIMQTGQDNSLKTYQKKLKKMMRRHLKKYRDVDELRFKNNSMYYSVMFPIRLKTLFISEKGVIRPFGKIYFKYRIHKRLKGGKRNLVDYPIDFVVTWVDGSDKVWLEEKKKYLDKQDSQTKKDNSEMRYRNWDTLRYWFRAIEKYAPWVNRVFFVTVGHTPEWLDMNNPKLKIVSHSDYIPKEFLPTFNSHTIENNLWRINELSEHFVYFNDDTFLTNEVNPETFFYREYPKLCALTAPYRFYDRMTSFDHALINGIGQINSSTNIRNSIKNNPEKWLNKKLKNYYEYSLRTYENSYISGLFFSHLSVPFRKNSMKKCYEKYSKKMNETSLNKFRSYNDVNHQIFQLYEIVNGSFEPVEQDYYGKSLQINMFNKDIIEENIKSESNKCLCLNDDEDVDDYNFEELKDMIHTNMKEKLPNKSSFEKY